MSDKEEIVFCKGGGCTAKLGAGILARVLERIRLIKGISNSETSIHLESFRVS